MRYVEILSTAVQLTVQNYIPFEKACNKRITLNVTQGHRNSINQSINQSIRALMQVDKPQRDRVNEYIAVPC